MTTTAEGVESTEEAVLIRSLGCDKIQGYYFGRPMPASEARSLFRTIQVQRA
jgi:EAL domain-containing protein (putative c-di-GMP-specific phosphodiesterase class I)